jgi:uncharacterized protein (TIGR02266 family)
MKLPVIVTQAHRGKALDVDSERETITLIGAQGERLGTLTWEAIIEYIRASNEKTRTVESRTQPRASLLIRVQYRTPEGKVIEGRASGIGGGGIFVESGAPLPVKTSLALTFSLPDRPDEWLEAKGEVAWICPQRDQYTAFPGMGIKFTDVSPKVREQVLQLVSSLRKPDQK